MILDKKKCLFHYVININFSVIALVMNEKESRKKKWYEKSSVSYVQVLEHKNIFTFHWYYLISMTIQNIQFSNVSLETQTRK